MDDMETIFVWILIGLGPSVAALAWFAWYSGALEGSGRDRREPWLGS